MRGASVGLAGPRGAGKSMLMRSIADGRYKFGSEDDKETPVGAVVLAPVRYRPVEFVAYVFTELCLAVLGGDERDEFSDIRAFVSMSVGLGALGVGIAILVSSGVFHWVSTLSARTVTGIVLVVIGGAVAALGSLMQIERAARREPTGNQLPNEFQVRARAKRCLHDVRNLDTVSQEFTGGAAISGFSFGGSRGVSSERQEPGFPELVREYSQFVAFVARRYPVIVAIDELDKMQSQQDARRFLNDIKAVFGQQRCFYLVSVSEDALSSFERRGMPLRDVFDSSFDTVIRIQPLTAAESVSLLKGRAVGIGLQAQLWCHVVSGGLPRDLIRAAREVVDEAGSVKVRFNDLAWPLAVKQMQAAEHAVRTMAVPSLLSDGTQPVLRWLSEVKGLSRDTVDVDALSERWGVDGLLGDISASELPAEDKRALKLAILQFALLAYHTATAVVHFQSLSHDDLQEPRAAVEEGQGKPGVAINVPGPGHAALTPPVADAEPGTGNGPAGGHEPAGSYEEMPVISALATARQEMVLAPELAWKRVSEVRRQMRDVPGHPFPAERAADKRAGGTADA